MKRKTVLKVFVAMLAAGVILLLIALDMNSKARRDHEARISSKQTMALIDSIEYNRRFGTDREPAPVDAPAYSPDATFWIMVGGASLLIASSFLGGVGMLVKGVKD